MGFDPTLSNQLRRQAGIFLTNCTDLSCQREVRFSTKKSINIRLERHPWRQTSEKKGAIWPGGFGLASWDWPLVGEYSIWYHIWGDEHPQLPVSWIFTKSTIADLKLRSLEGQAEDSDVIPKCGRNVLSLIGPAWLGLWNATWPCGTLWYPVPPGNQHGQHSTACELKRMDFSISLTFPVAPWLLRCILRILQDQVRDNDLVRGSQWLQHLARIQSSVCFLWPTIISLHFRSASFASAQLSKLLWHQHRKGMGA